ncbi:MAG: RiPP maturation radical SAM C-methyltransferase [Thermoguttaceae bacterium]
MPFSNLRWPNFGLSLLKAAATRREIGCDLAYLNFDFAERVGLEHYTWIADCFAFILGGERLFARHFFDDPADDEDYCRDVLMKTDDRFTDEDRRAYEASQQHVAPFLDGCMESIDWSRYAVVGFAATFQQTLPALCLARRIKQVRPEIKILFGGAACQAPMGIELARQFPLIDYVFLGEADLTFPAVVEQILVGGPVSLPQGVVGQDTGHCRLSLRERSVTFAERKATMAGRKSPQLDPAPDLLHAGQAEAGCPAVDLNALPYPDFDDYFARLNASPFRPEIEPLFFFETSRGCWWGQKHQCKFCGLNGNALAFRSKEPRRVIEELRYLVDRHGVRRASTADNILDYRYFDSLLPLLQESGLGLGFGYELKCNLTKPQVQSLVRAGLGAAQLGIETFSTRILKGIHKGASALQNLQTLKWFSEAGVEVKWNFLYGFPGEDPAEYAALAQLAPLLYHLVPPVATGRVRLDRFSPYFRDPAANGMANPRPIPAFRYIYPFPDEVLARLAYYYEYDYADGRTLDYVAPALTAVERWRELAGQVTLRWWDRGDGLLLLTDTRPCAVALQHRLTGFERHVHLYCDTGRTFAQIRRHAAEHAGDWPCDEPAIRRLLDRWLADRIMVRLDDRYLSLAVRAPE